MSETLSLALQITLIGMGLVFLSLAILGLIIEMVVRLGASLSRRSQPAEAPAAMPAAQPALPASDLTEKQLAAALAVAAALAEQAQSVQPQLPIPPTPIVSAWQAVMRTAMLNKRGKPG